MLNCSRQSKEVMADAENAQVGSGQPECLLSDLFAPMGYDRPIEATVEELAAAAESHGLAAFIYQFSEMLPGESLPEHVQSQLERGDCPGPWIEVRCFIVQMFHSHCFRGRRCSASMR
jgi:hypothetical protein